MSLLKKMFGKKEPIEELRQLHSRQEWASLLSASGRLNSDGLDEELAAEIESMQNDAGDALAVINLEEGIWAQKSGNLLRARDDYQLAIEQARTATVQQRVKDALAALDQGELPEEVEVEDQGPAIHASCSSGCATTEGAQVANEEQGLDEDARIELLLATMPAEMAERYMSAGETFRKAWLYSQDGDDEQALLTLNQVPGAEHNALFLFERGALMARSGQHQKAHQDLQAALTIDPDLFPAFETLTEVLLANGRLDEVEKRLKKNLTDERFPAYSWGKLAMLHAQRGEAEPALAAGLKALDEGLTDASIVTLCAQLMEQAERYDEAEKMLMRLPSGGGCRGGAHPLLAEFWLRRGQNLNQALEAFKGAMRQERHNPRWLLGICKVYLAKGWNKEASEQVEVLMKQKDLPEPIRNEIKAVADQLRKN